MMQSSHDELCQLSLIEAADAIRAGEVTSVELLDACLSRLDELDEKLNIAIWTDREIAYSAAKRLDGLRPTGLLHGVPLAHKDMFYIEGNRSTGGSPIRQDFVATQTATVIERLASAGSYSFAGLNLAEFALNATGHNPHHGDCRNPWNPDYITGGSSSGSAVAVATGITAASLGSDTGGSIRLPAAATGVTGLRPTQFKVSTDGVMPLSFSMDTVGVLARSAKDCARMLTVIAGPDTDFHAGGGFQAIQYEDALDGDLRGIRVGVATNLLETDHGSDVFHAFETATHVLVARGASVERAQLPHIDAIRTYGSLVSKVEAASIHVPWIRTRPESYSPHIFARMYASLAIPAAYYVQALSRRGQLLRCFSKDVFSAFDVIVAPTIPTALPTIAASDIDKGQAGIHRRSFVGDNTRPFSYLGLPCLSVPCGFDQNGLPVGLQIVGRPLAEATVLKVGDAFQHDTAWHRLRPPAIRADAGAT